MSTAKLEKQVLVFAFAVNFLFFAVEIGAGFLSNSMGLIADSLDMLADAFVYGISLLAVGAVIARQKRVARLSGYFQIILAILGLVEVIRRSFGWDEVPDFRGMIVVSFLALLANAATFYVIGKAKGGGPHIAASRIFTSNDIVVNFLVIASGVLVYWLDVKWPDLVAGGIIFLVVANGARKILKVSH
jgi:Co/Zn/Cd efflux system component